MQEEINPLLSIQHNISSLIQNGSTSGFNGILRAKKLFCSIFTHFNLRRGTTAVQNCDVIKKIFSLLPCLRSYSEYYVGGGLGGTWMPLLMTGVRPV